MLIYDIMTGWKRWIYSKVGWEYDPLADEKQKHQKYLVTEQIRNTKDIQKILKEQGEIKEQDFEHNIYELPTFEHSLNHYTQALSNPDTPYKDIMIDIPTGYTRYTRPDTCSVGLHQRCRPDTPIPLVPRSKTVKRARKRKRH
jgi:hypothetical protein